MKRVIFAVLILALAIPAFSAIGAGAFSIEAKRGFSWHFSASNTLADWPTYEAAVITYLEELGKEWNKQRIEANSNRRDQIDKIKEALRVASNEQVAAVLSALGLN
jgi:hypothetical protein